MQRKISHQASSSEDKGITNVTTHTSNWRCKGTWLKEKEEDLKIKTFFEEKAESAANKMCLSVKALSEETSWRRVEDTFG